MMKRKIIIFGLLAVLLIFLLIFGCAKSTEKKIIYSGEASFAELNNVHPPSGPKFCYYLDLKNKEMPAGTTYDDLAYKYPLPSAATMWLEYNLYKGVRTEKGIFLNSCAGKTRVHWVCDGKVQKGGNWINYVSGLGTKEEKLSMGCPSVIDPAATCSTHFIPPGLTVSIVNCKSKEHLIGLGFGCMDKGDDDSDGKIDCKDSDCNGQSCDANKLTKKCNKFQCVDLKLSTSTSTTPNTINLPKNTSNITTTPESNCADGLDNDADAKIDCQDIDCSGKTNVKGFVCCKNDNEAGCPTDTKCDGGSYGGSYQCLECLPTEWECSAGKECKLGKCVWLNAPISNCTLGLTGTLKCYTNLSGTYAKEELYYANCSTYLSLQVKKFCGISTDFCVDGLGCK